LSQDTKEHFVSVTEISGDEVSQEQVARMCERYVWAAEYCKDKDVLEVACGAGQGIGVLSRTSSRFAAGDFSADLVQIAKSHYGKRAEILQFDAQDMPFEDNSLDVIILFEAIYYIPDAKKFLLECRRLLRPEGYVLIATANKDLFDFNPSPHTHTYYGVVELNKLFADHSFECSFFGGTPISEISWKQKLLRPVKRLVVGLNLMPKTMAGKKIFKRLIFGKLVPLPAEITASTQSSSTLEKLKENIADDRHKVIYCAAKLL
jgi:SAM-dependent methyltransferase